jgi:hypothetical protein
MCSFNRRKYKKCTAAEKHTFKELIKCAAARARPNKEPCPEEQWEDLRSVAKTVTGILCPVCNDVKYIPEGEAANV